MIDLERAAGNQSISTPDSAVLTIPAGQPWWLPFTVRYDGLVTGDAPQYFVSTGNFGAAGSLNIAFYTLGATTSSSHQGRILVFADTITATADTPIVSATKISTGAHQYVLYSDGTTVRLYRCPIVDGVVATEASVVLEGSSTSPFLLKELNGSAFVIGGRADGATNRRSDQSHGRTAFGFGNITLAEIARMANGEDLVADLKKTPVVYVRLSSITDITDAGPNKLPFTLSGSPTTSAEPAYNFQGAPVESEPQPQPENAITLVMPTAERIYQRVNGTAIVKLAGATAGAAPASVERRLYKPDGVEVVAPYAGAGATFGTNTWEANTAVPAGPGKRRAQVRSKNGSGTELAESAISTERFGVGDIQACIGSSGAERLFVSTSGSGMVPRDDISWHDGTDWKSFGTVGAAIVTANSLAEQAGVPIGMLDAGQGGSTLEDWISSGYSGWTAFAADVASIGGKLASCYITVGSNSAAEGLVISQATHEANLRTLFARVRGLTGQPNLLIVLGGMNRRTKHTTASQAVFDQQSNWVRMAEKAVGRDPNVVHVQNLDFTLNSDGIHLAASANGYPASAARAAYQGGAAAYGGAVLCGPEIVKMTASGNDVIVTVAHRGSTDFSPATGITGFTGTGQDDLPLTLVSATRVDATTIKVTWDRPAKTMQYLAGSAPAVGTPVYGNTAQPLPMTAETEMALTAAGEEVPDNTAPVMSGAISITNVSTSGATLAFQAATDNVGVAGYEYSINAGASYVNTGLSRSFATPTLTASTTYQVRVRAYDDAGNRSAPLSASFTTLANEPPVEIVIDASKIPASRKVVFPGGTRVVPFGTLPNFVVPDAPYYRDGKWWVDKVPEDERYYVADISIDLAEMGTTAAKVEAVVAGVNVIEQPVIQGSLIPVKLGGFDELRGALNFCTFRVTLANGEQIDRTLWFSTVDGRWALEKDPEDKRYYVFDVGFDLADSKTTATSATAIPVGVVELVAPQVQGSLIVVKLGSMDGSADPLNYCKLRIECANGERFFRTIHFDRVDN